MNSSASNLNHLIDRFHEARRIFLGLHEEVQDQVQTLIAEDVDPKTIHPSVTVRRKTIKEDDPFLTVLLEQRQAILTEHLKSRAEELYEVQCAIELLTTHLQTLHQCDALDRIDRLIKLRRESSKNLTAYNINVSTPEEIDESIEPSQ